MSRLGRVRPLHPRREIRILRVSPAELREVRAVSFHAPDRRYVYSYVSPRRIFPPPRSGLLAHPPACRPPLVPHRPAVFPYCCASFRWSRKLFATTSAEYAARNHDAFIYGRRERLTADLRHPPRRRPGVRSSLKTDKIVSKKGKKEETKRERVGKEKRRETQSPSAGPAG